MPELRALLDGYRRFRAGPYMEQRARYDTLAEGQAPGVMIIACSDSRVDPTTVFDVGPGQAFVLRNVANLVPPHDPDGHLHGVSAAIEFAVTQLKVHHVVVFGHGRCGGVKASLEGTFDGLGEGAGGFIGQWVKMIGPARDRIRKAGELSPDLDLVHALELEAIRLSLDNLRTFPFVVEAEAAGTLQLQGAHFDIADGRLLLLDHSTGRFAAVPVKQPDAPIG